MIGTQDPAESIFVMPQANGAPIKVTGFFELCHDQSRGLLLPAEHNRDRVYLQTGMSCEEGSTPCFS
jgi:hypothetical protein